LPFIDRRHQTTGRLTLGWGVPGSVREGTDLRL